MKIVVNIGCIECGVSSAIVGIFDDEAAQVIVQKLNRNKNAGWREGGQNYYEAFDLPEINIINQDYMDYILEEGGLTNP